MNEFLQYSMMSSRVCVCILYDIRAWFWGHFANTQNSSHYVNMAATATATAISAANTNSIVIDDPSCKLCSSTHHTFRLGSTLQATSARCIFGRIMFLSFIRDTRSLRTFNWTTSDNFVICIQYPARNEFTARKANGLAFIWQVRWI